MVSQQGEWQVSGNAAELYERYHVPAIVGPWAADLVAFAPPRPGERVLDVACGTRVLARLAAQHAGPSGRVVGLDLNAGMFAVARSLSPVPGAPIEWHEGSALAMPFPDASFDLVLCQYGLQFFPDRPAALREMRRVLVPGGRLALSVWRAIRHNPFHVAMAEVLARHVGPAAVPTFQAAFSLGSAEELRALIAGAGFSNAIIRAATRTHRVGAPEEFIRWWLVGSPMADAVGQVDEISRTALTSEVISALRPYMDAGGLSFPTGTHLAVAHT